jgi:penicillin-binding protein 1A
MKDTKIVIKNYPKKAVKILFFLLSFFAIVILILMLVFKLFVSTFKDDVIDLNLTAAKMKLTSRVYAMDKTGNYNEYQKIFSGENRVWVDFSKIPQYMKDAIIAIEDKRFYKHGGIDFIRVTSAFANAVLGNKSYGGSSLTQQLIKNITEDSEVKFSRKIREMARAVRLEERYSKDEILESYLNIVNFGAGSRGVQAAAGIYFDKNIWECNIAECAAIAAITQNPGAYNPFVHFENNKKRREIVIDEMFFQKKISESEYKKALEISKNLKFSKSNPKNNKSSENFIRNWYIEMLCKDLISDISSKYKIKKNLAEDILYSGGLKIYACIDPDAQAAAEETVRDIRIMPADKELELGFTMMDYNGKIIAVLGSSKSKTTNLIYDRANSARRQPGSTIKPIAVYTPAINLGIFTYSSKIPDKPLKIDIDGSGKLKDWPENWYKKYFGEVILQWALEKSANAPAAQVLDIIGVKKSYEFLVQKLGFKNLDISDSNSIAALAAGGTHIGVTVKEMTAAFQIFGSGGKFFRPRSYSYVTDKNGKTILENREDIPRQAISEEAAYVMNRLLRRVIIGKEGTGRKADIKNWEIVGKTGTTNDDFDSWFIGLSPRAVAGIWMGYDRPRRIRETGKAIEIWKSIMTKYLLNFNEAGNFSYPKGVITAPFCSETGFLANSECPHVSLGYYTSGNVPAFCFSHGGSNLEPIPDIPEEARKDESEEEENEDEENFIISQNH